MAGLQLYALLYVLVNQSILTEEGSININRTTNSQPVNTVAKGYAGESPGAAMVEIQVDSAVPSAGFEMNPGEFMKNLKECEIGVMGPGGKQLTAVGFIVSDSFSHSVNQESKLSFTFRGKFVDWD